MAVLQGNAKQGSVRGFYPKTIEGSLRFNDDDSAYLSWTPESAGNRKTWTWSGWVKRSNLATGIIQGLFEANDPSSTQIVAGIRFETDDRLKILDYTSGYTTEVKTTQVFRDTSSWYHIVVAYDTTQATASNRVKLYVNGVQVTDFSIATYPSQNSDGYINTTGGHYLGACIFVNVIEFLDGYLAEVHFTDGTAYDADAFGEFKNGVWVAKTPDVTYGTNGFYLDFQDDTEVEAFNTVLYQGNGTSQSITGMGFQPDLVWIKARNTNYSNQLIDVIRGGTNVLFSDRTDAEGTYQSITSFDSDGFTVSTELGANGSGTPFVAWGWKAGDSNVSNTDGSITSTVRANDTYGFSIVSYTGTGSNATWGHGLSTAPDMVIVKRRTNGNSNWHVYHSSLAATQIMELSTTSGVQTDAPSWNSTAPTSSVVSVGTSNATNMSGESFIAYCWAEKSGYSKFGSYVGSSGDPSVTTGFRPAFVLIKRTDAAGNSWSIWDNTRDTDGDGNLDLPLFPNLSDAEDTSSYTDYVQFTDTGFVVKGNGAFVNGGTSSYEYIYAAFADTREAAFWLDQSGNDNDWQPVNLDHNDTLLDSPTDNFATLNPLNRTNAGSLSDGNLVITSGSGVNHTCIATYGMTSGKYYWEATLNSVSDSAFFGIIRGDQSTVDMNIGLTAGDFAYLLRNNGTVYRNGATQADVTGYLSAGVVFRGAYDADTGKFWIGVNDTWYGSGGTPDVAAGTFPLATVDSYDSDAYLPWCRTLNATMTFNFGQQPFKYDPPA